MNVMSKRLMSRESSVSTVPEARRRQAIDRHGELGQGVTVTYAEADFTDPAAPTEHAVYAPLGASFWAAYAWHGHLYGNAFDWNGGLWILDSIVAHCSGESMLRVRPRLLPSPDTRGRGSTRNSSVAGTRRLVVR
jgi:hypothetical protein